MHSRNTFFSAMESFFIHQKEHTNIWSTMVNYAKQSADSACPYLHSHKPLTWQLLKMITKQHILWSDGTLFHLPKEHINISHNNYAEQESRGILWVNTLVLRKLWFPKLLHSISKHCILWRVGILFHLQKRTCKQLAQKLCSIGKSINFGYPYLSYAREAFDKTEAYLVRKDRFQFPAFSSSIVKTWPRLALRRPCRWAPAPAPSLQGGECDPSPAECERCCTWRHKINFKTWACTNLTWKH